MERKLYFVTFSYSDPDEDSWGMQTPHVVESEEEACIEARKWVKQQADNIKKYYEELKDKVLFINSGLYKSSKDFYDAISKAGFDYEDADEYIYVLTDEAESGSVLLHRLGHGVEEHWEANIHVITINEKITIE